MQIWGDADACPRVIKDMHLYIVISYDWRGNNRPLIDNTFERFFNPNENGHLEAGGHLCESQQGITYP